MNEIKPTAGFGPANPSADSTAEAKPPNRDFSVIAGKESASSAEAATTPSLAAKFSKVDLQDPAKLDHIVRSSVSELVEEQTSSLPISSADKQALTDFLAEDPLFRQQVESYLRKALP